jgi:hypothetical protein
MSFITTDVLGIQKFIYAKCAGDSVKAAAVGAEVKERIYAWQGLEPTELRAKIADLAGLALANSLLASDEEKPAMLKKLAEAQALLAQLSMIEDRVRALITQCLEEKKPDDEESDGDETGTPAGA